MAGHWLDIVSVVKHDFRCGSLCFYSGYLDRRQYLSNYVPTSPLTQARSTDDN